MTDARAPSEVFVLVLGYSRHFVCRIVFDQARTASPAVNYTAGVPGPAAEPAHVTDTEVGFP